MTVFELKSTLLNALAIVLKSLSPNEINAQLTTHNERLRHLNDLPFFLDLSAWSDDALSSDDLKAVIDVFAKWRIKISGLMHPHHHMADLASQLGLFYQPSLSPRKVNVDAKYDGQNHQTTEKKEYAPYLLIERPVRSGQQIYAKHQDLIVTATVNEGAEIIADGSIHVYAPVRGRVFAGASGDFNARIFISSMQAQLVCIAGIYRLIDQNLPSNLHKKNVKISLQNNKLYIKGIST